MDTLNGFWILSIRGKGRQRTKIFPGEGNGYPVGTKVLVAAFTQKGERITRIPLVIAFRYKKDELQAEEEILETIEFLSKAFKIRQVITTNYEVGEEIEVLYIFDDIQICKSLKINHNLYLTQFESFNLIIQDLISHVYHKNIYIFKGDQLITVNENYKALTISINKNYKLYLLDNLFIRLVSNVSEEIPCHYIQNFNDSHYRRELINTLLILKEFEEIKYKMLYNLYINLKIDYTNMLNLLEKRTKIIRVSKWSCKKDCTCYCGLTSPLHSIIDERREGDKNASHERQNNEVPKLADIDNIALLFGGCHLLRNKRFLINDEQIHMGVLEFILPRHKSNKEKLENLFFANNELFFDVQQDIESKDIRTIRNEKSFSSILSFSNESSFIKVLLSRGGEYRPKIILFRDSQPFIDNKYKIGQWKTNILQFIDSKTFDTVFSYAPLQSIGFLERAIVSYDLTLNTPYFEDALKKIAQFSANAEDIVRVKINKDDFKKGFSYVYAPDTTIFTKDGLEKFYLTTAIKFAILFTLIDNAELKIEESGISISDSIINRASLASIMLITYRDKILFRLTKKYKLKKSFKEYLKEYRPTFIYHRDIERKFSTYSKSTLNQVIDELIRDSMLERIITHNIKHKKIIVYKVNRVRERLPFTGNWIKGI